MKIKLSPKAQNDVNDIWNYTAKKWGVRQAEVYVLQLESCIQTLTTNHNCSQDASYVRHGYRKIISGSHVIFYQQTETSITIVRILEQRMDIDRHL